MLSLQRNAIRRQHGQDVKSYGSVPDMSWGPYLSKYAVRADRKSSPEGLDSVNIAFCHLYKAQIPILYSEHTIPAPVLSDLPSLQCLAGIHMTRETSKRLLRIQIIRSSILRGACIAECWLRRLCGTWVAQW